MRKSVRIRFFLKNEYVYEYRIRKYFFINLVKIKQSKLKILAYTFNLPTALSDRPLFK